MTQKLDELGIKNYKQLRAHIDNYNNAENDDGQKNAGYDDDILIVLKIISIYQNYSIHTQNT